MKPKIDFCFKELMEFAEVRRGFRAAVLGISPEEVVSTELKPVAVYPPPFILPQMETGIIFLIFLKQDKVQYPYMDAFSK